MTKYRIILYHFLLLSIMLITTQAITAQVYLDFGRALQWKLYGDAVSKKMIEQEKMQLAISGNHIYMTLETGKIVDIQEEMNSYLHSYHDKLKLAAMCFSLYNECKMVVENLQSVNKSISENPEGIIATTFVDERGKIYVMLFSQTLSLINDIYHIFNNKDEEAKESNSEYNRIYQLDLIRKRLVTINKQLNIMAKYIKYTNLNDLLNRILKKHVKFQTKTRQEIAQDCFVKWRDHYSTSSVLFK